jgi:chromosome segregation ATPase
MTGLLVQTMKNDNQVKDDINGRLHSLDQTVRSVEKRLRAVERRLSVDVPVEDTIPEYETNFEEALESTRIEIISMRAEMDNLMQNNSQNHEYNIGLEELNSEITSLNSQIMELREENTKISEQIMAKDTTETEEIQNLSVEIRNDISQLNMRLEKAENHNRISIGSVKVPIELSGIVGAAILALTGFLIMNGQWNIIRSPYFSFGIALVFAVAVLMKFYMANSQAA